MAQDPTRRRLLEALVTRGGLTPDAARRADRLAAQAAITIDTAVLELGLLEEDHLVRIFAEVLGVAPALAADLATPDPDAVARVPRKLIKSSGILPFRLSGTRLSIAMRDFDDLGLVDELAFVTSRRIEPCFAVTPRREQALAQLLGDKAPPRLSGLLERLDTRRATGTPTEAILSAETVVASPPASPVSRSGPAPPSPPSYSPTNDDLTRPTLPIPDWLAPKSPRPWDQESAAPTTPAAASPPIPVPSATPLEPAPPATAPPVAQPALASPQFLSPPPAPTAPSPSGPSSLSPSVPSPSVPVPSAPQDLDELGERLADVHERDQVAHLVADYLASRFGRVVLLMVRGREVAGWMGRGVNGTRLAALRISLAEPSLFLNLREGMASWSGNLPDLASHRNLASTWGGDLPDQCALHPIAIRGRLVAVLYADGATVEGAEDDLAEIASKAGIAFEICILRLKLGGR